MTTDSTQPQSELEPSLATGPGQSQGHRRRRRRRKNKTSAPIVAQGLLPLTPEPAAEQAPAAPVAAPQAQRPAQPRPPRQARSGAPQNPRQGKQQGSQQGNPQGGQQGSTQGQGRKKKVFQKSSASTQQPGNNASSSSQGKRKGSNGSGGGSKQRTPREFVGPMDHSYRIANGNQADGPASTIQIMNSGHSNHFQENFSPAPTIPVKENAPTRIFCFIEDLFFLAKIQETARKLGVKVEFVKGDKETLTRLTEAPESERPALLVFDLNNVSAKPITLIPKYKTKLKKATSIIGFLNHLQGDLKAKAVEAGCDSVMPRSAFSQTLPNLLRRYGIEEEEEYFPQPM